MPSNTDSLVTILNTTNLQKNDPRLYQVIKSLVENLLAAEKATAATVQTSGFVTSATGGAANVIAMFTGPRNIENVTVAGITNALHLLTPSFAHQFLMGA